MTRETDLAFLEDVQFILNTGESFPLAAARFGCNTKALDARIRRAQSRVGRGSEMGWEVAA